MHAFWGDTRSLLIAAAVLAGAVGLAMLAQVARIYPSLNALRLRRERSFRCWHWS